MDIREAIEDRMRQKGWTTYELAKALRGKVPYRTVYNFIHNTNYEHRPNMRLKALGHVLDALGLKLVADDK